MKNIKWMLSLSVLSAGLILPGLANAADNKAEPATPAVHAVKTPTKPEVPAEVAVKGTVVVLKDASGKMTGVELKADDGAVYTCSPKVQCEVLATSDGKVVTCHGMVSTKDGKSTLHIKSIETK